MIKQEDDAVDNETKYASLTAGLLARKGEAVPAAAAFTAEAIAQHIPARRLAQEAERVLQDRRPNMDRVIEDTSVAWRETSGESRGAQVVTEHRDMIERAFNESVRQDEGMPSDRRPQGSSASVEEVFDQGLSSQPTASEMDLGDRRELNLPFVGPTSDDLEATPSGAAAALEEHLEDGSALSDLNDSGENWFEKIVSNAISDAEGQRAGAETLANADEPDLFDGAALGEGAEGSLVSPTFAQGMAQDRETPQPGTGDSDSEPAKAPTGGCGDKAARVREAIKSGKTNVAARSAMRLDPRRFIRLSLSAQKLQLSSQEVMIAALDSYMDALDEEVFSDCACMKNGLI